MQEIYINLDDSGKLSTNERLSVYGGIIFFSKHEKDKFITQYRSIIKSIKEKYEENTEIKNINIKPQDKRRIMNYLKKYYVVGLVINNSKVYKHIIKSKAAKGRFLDYSIRRMVKEVINKLIKESKINPFKPVKIVINIDNQTTKSNGYYNLKDGLLEELKYGISSFNYGVHINPIIFSELKLDIKYQDSRTSFSIQAADLLAGTIRKISLQTIDNQNSSSKLSHFVNYNLFLP